MSILVNKRTRVITQGATGKFHAAACRSYGAGRKCFVGGVNPGKTGQAPDGLPIFGSVKEAKAETGANASLICVPPAVAAAAIEDAIAADLHLVVCTTEGIPVQDMIRVRRRLEDSRTLLLGPSCPGVVTPGEIMVGIMPGHIHERGRVGIVSRSGELTCQAVRQLAAYGLGPSTVVGIGSHPVGGLTRIDVLKMFDDDPGTDAVLMVGEVGDDPEATCARWIADHMRKPVVGLVAGDDAPGAMQVLGIKVTRDPAAMGELLASVVAPQWLPFD